MLDSGTFLDRNKEQLEQLEGTFFSIRVSLCMVLASSIYSYPDIFRNKNNLAVFKKYFYLPFQPFLYEFQVNLTIYFFKLYLQNNWSVR